MSDLPDATIVPFPPPSEEDVLRLWHEFQDASARADAAYRHARAAAERFRLAFLAREGKL